jgi:hypothetical protein
MTVDEISLPADILDMKYVQLQDSEYLAVLVVDGHHVFFKAGSGAKFSEQKKLNLRVHKKLGAAPAVYGVLACSQYLIASSLGSGVIVRDLRVPSKLFVQASSASDSLLRAFSCQYQKLLFVCRAISTFLRYTNVADPTGQTPGVECENKITVSYCCCDNFDRVISS